MKKAGAFSAALTASTFAALPKSAKASDRPNILFAIADDWSWPHAGVYGDKVIRTPVFDRIAEEGVLFTGSYCAAPTCTASRGGVLTGQAIHRLEEGGNLYGFLRRKFPVYPNRLEAAGYHVGLTGKGWAPGTLEGSGRTRNPAGPVFKDYQAFMDSVPADKPFCFWFGSSNPHRPYELGAGAKSGMKIEDVVVPPFLPDTPEVRSDILDYNYEVQLFDQQVGELMKILEASGRTENTILVVTSDNGMPFPRSKANLYDIGNHMPLAVRWPAKVKGGRTKDGFVSHCDFAPTFLEAAGLTPPSEMTGRSFLDVLTGEGKGKREMVFFERERHANARAGNLSYPSRAVRTKDFLYILNFRPDRWPAGDPEKFGDIDGGPSKTYLLAHRQQFPKLFDLACGKRPAEELYDLKHDPWQMVNVAEKPDYAGVKAKMRAALDRWMMDTADPRATSDDDRWDLYPYSGNPTTPAQGSQLGTPPSTPKNP